MTHIAIQEKLDGKTVDWMEQVSDEQIILNQNQRRILGLWRLLRPQLVQPVLHVSQRLKQTQPRLTQILALRRASLIFLPLVDPRLLLGLGIQLAGAPGPLPAPLPNSSCAGRPSIARRRSAVSDRPPRLPHPAPAGCCQFRDLNVILRRACSASTVARRDSAADCLAFARSANRKTESGSASRSSHCSA